MLELPNWEKLMDVQLILPVKVSITIDTMMNFNSDFNEHGDDDVTRKQTFMFVNFTHSFVQRDLVVIKSLV